MTLRLTLPAALLASVLASPLAAGGLAPPVLEDNIAVQGAHPCTTTTIYVPRGYKLAFDDGRLNPCRGPRTVQGDAQMAQVLDVTEIPMAGLSN